MTTPTLKLSSKLTGKSTASALYIVRLLKLAVANQRVVKEIGIESQRECLGYRLIAKSVERTADHATKIAENTLQLTEPVNEEIQ